LKFQKEESLKLQAFCVRLSSDFCPESHAVFTMRYKKGVPLLGADVTDQVEIIAYCKYLITRRLYIIDYSANGGGI